jgi:hypothetical protein
MIEVVEKEHKISEIHEKRPVDVVDRNGALFSFVFSCISAQVNKYTNNHL